MTRRPAFTVIELLVAVTLAAMLMAAVLEVLQVIAKGQSALLKSPPTEPWLDQLRQNLEWDLRHSRTIEVVGDNLVIHGFGGRSTNGTANHHASEVRYACVRGANFGWLRRDETDLRSSAEVSRELVAGGIGGFEVQLTSGGQANSPAAPQTSSKTATRPDAISVTLALESIPPRRWSQVFHLK